MIVILYMGISGENVKLEKGPYMCYVRFEIIILHDLVNLDN